MQGFEMSDEAPAILIIDTPSPNLETLSEQLIRANFRVQRAETGAQILEQVQDLRPDLMLLEVSSLRAAGFETCRRLKANSSTAHIPVIFLLTGSDSDIRASSFEVGGADCLIRP